MDWIDSLEHFNTFGVYPLATLVHIFVGVWCGRDLEASRYHKDITRAIPGTVVFVGWLAYEISEFARVHDEVDVDIANGLAGVAIAIVVSRVLILIERRLNNGHRKTG